MPYRVYHLARTADMPTLVGPDKEYFKNNYELVAILDAANTDEAFRRTNHIDSHWFDDHSLIFTREGSRSTSVGDIICDDCGVYWFCAPIGWICLEDLK